MDDGPVVVTLVVTMFLGVLVGFACGDITAGRSARNDWCRARFHAATTAADSLAIVRDTLPRGCTIKAR